MFERFTERARHAVVLAQEEARLALKHDYIGTEHLLLGLLREEEGVAAQVLASLDITLERVRAQVVRIVGAGEDATGGQIPFTPRAKKVLELALREALSLDHNYIGTEHILLGLARENDGVAMRILLDFDVDQERIRSEVIRLLSGPGAATGTMRAMPEHALGVEPWFRVGPTAGLRRLLMVAAARALDDGRSEIDASDVLLALTRDGKIGPLLAGLGVDEPALREAIESARASEEPPPPATED